MRCDELRYGLRNNSVIDPTIGYFLGRRSSLSASRRMANRSLGLFPEPPDLPCLRIPIPKLPSTPPALEPMRRSYSHRTAALAVLAVRGTQSQLTTSMTTKIRFRGAGPLKSLKRLKLNRKDDPVTQPPRRARQRGGRPY